MSTMGTEKGVVGKFFGYSFTRFGSNLRFKVLGSREKTLNNLEDGLRGNGNTVLALVNSTQLRKTDDQNPSTAASILGTHWVTIINSENGKITYWEYGGTKVIDRDKFMNSLAGGLVVQPASGH